MENQIEDETPEQLHERIEKLTKGLLSEKDDIDSIIASIKKDHKRKFDRVNETKKSKLKSYVSIANKGNNKENNEHSDTSEDEFMKEYFEAKRKLEDVRDVINRLIDHKFSEHNMSYFIKDKGLGVRTVQYLKYHRDKMKVSTLFENFERML
jgi:uncharacterized membrane protein YheB (UPF0754 family)